MIKAFIFYFIAVAYCTIRFAFMHFSHVIVVSVLKLVWNAHLVLPSCILQVNEILFCANYVHSISWPACYIWIMHNFENGSTLRSPMHHQLLQVGAVFVELLSMVQFLLPWWILHLIKISSSVVCIHCEYPDVIMMFISIWWLCVCEHTSSHSFFAIMKVILNWCTFW